MKIKNQLPLGRLIGKIDNDFNISESDWIPRVAAWVIDALSQMKILPMAKKKRVLEVSERIAQFPCEINGTELRVFDENGVEIPELDDATNCCCPTKATTYSSEIGVFDSTNKTGINTVLTATISDPTSRNFVFDGKNIELNFDTNVIRTETYEVATYYDDYYDCECPYIYDNGLLLEALSWYVLFKYLSRGSSHPVYSLASNSPVTNPWTQWNLLKNKAANAVKIEISKAGDGWNNFFYNSTFLPRS